MADVASPVLMSCVSDKGLEWAEVAWPGSGGAGVRRWVDSRGLNVAVGDAGPDEQRAPRAAPSCHLSCCAQECGVRSPYLGIGVTPPDVGAAFIIVPVTDNLLDI